MHSHSDLIGVRVELQMCETVVFSFTLQSKEQKTSDYNKKNNLIL